jgi:hypothetical protein
MQKGTRYQLKTDGKKGRRSKFPKKKRKEKFSNRDKKPGSTMLSDRNLKIRKIAKGLKRNNKPKESAKDSPEGRGIPRNYFHPNPSDKEDEENHLYYIPP